MTPSPFANSIMGRPYQVRTMEVRPGDSAYDPRTQGIMGNLMSQGPENSGRRWEGISPSTFEIPTPRGGYNQYSGLLSRSEPVNPFEGNEQYQALMEYQKSMQPNQEQQDRMGELRTAFEGTGGYKDYRIQQMEQQMQRMQQPRMQQSRMMGIGGMRPNGMQPYQGFGRPQMMQQPQRPSYQGPMQQRQPQQQYGQPQQQYGMMMGGYQQNPYQQQRPQPQQFGGYSMGQQMGGYGGYGGMSNPYQPQQMGSYNPNNSMGYGQQQMNQFQGYDIMR